MKHSSFFHLLLLLASFFGLTTVIVAQTGNEMTNSVTKRLEILLHQKEFFRLDKELQLFRESLPESKKLYYQCFLNNAFNRNAEARSKIDTLLNFYGTELNDSLTANLLLLKADSYFKEFNYSMTAHVDSLVLSRYKTSMDSSLISDTEKDLLICHALSIIPSQQTIISGSTTIRWKNDAVGLMKIPVQCKGRS